MDARLAPAVAQGTLQDRSSASSEINSDITNLIRAGMRARAVADFCERSDLPVVMIDGSGRVLHVAASAERLLGGDFAVAAGHLVGRSGNANRRVERAVMRAIGEPGCDGALDSSDTDQLFSLIGLPMRDDSPFQICKGLLLFLCPGREAETRLDALRALLVR